MIQIVMKHMFMFYYLYENKIKIKSIRQVCYKYIVCYEKNWANTEMELDHFVISVK